MSLIGATMLLVAIFCVATSFNSKILTSEPGNTSLIELDKPLLPTRRVLNEI